MNPFLLIPLRRLRLLRELLLIFIIGGAGVEEYRSLESVFLNAWHVVISMNYHRALESHRREY